MNLNEITAGISLLGNCIVKLDVENSLIDMIDDYEKKIDFYIDEPHFWDEEKNRFGRIQIGFTIDINGEEENENCHIELIIEGAFVAEDNMDVKEFEKLVQINGAAALVGIARGKIESISANLFSRGKIEIPFINVIDYYNEMAN